MDRRVRVDFMTAFNAFKKEKKRICCQYGAVTTYYNPESGRTYYFNENWIASGKWYIVD